MLTVPFCKLIILFLFISTAVLEKPQQKFIFDHSAFSCLMRIMYKRLMVESKPVIQKDSYLYYIYSKMYYQRNDYEPYFYMNNINIIKDVNQFFTDFVYLKKSYRDQIINCRLDRALVNVKKRCIKKYGEKHCKQINEVAYGKDCPWGYVNFKTYFCYPKCPPEFEEYENYCLKKNYIKVNF